MIDEPILELDQIQGNIIPGFKKDHEVLLFFQILDPSQTKVWLSQISPFVSSAAEVLQGNRFYKKLRSRQGGEPQGFALSWLNLAISASGLRQLVEPSEVDLIRDNAFKLGMSKRSELLNDPVDQLMPGHRSQWLVGGSNQERQVDLVLMIASDRADFAATLSEQYQNKAEQEGGLKLIHKDIGRTREDFPGREHFGFKDGISEPAIRGMASATPNDFIVERTIPELQEFKNYAELFASPGQPLVWPGHFVFGYPRQDDLDPLKPIPEGNIGPTWLKNGSFLVFRRLKQDVVGFWQAMEQFSIELSDENRSINAEQVAARFVGRWPSGAPLSRSPEKDNLELGASSRYSNYFQYFSSPPGSIPSDSFPLSIEDQEGKICPFSAHIRKVNPRDMATDLGTADKTFKRLLLRRGLPYGTPIANVQTATLEEAQIDRGLLFMAYQTSLERQFEFLMTDWVNRRDRPEAGGGEDPILGQPTRIPPESRQFTLTLPDNDKKNLNLMQEWIVVTGGEYFFSPSLNFLQSLNS